MLVADPARLVYFHSVFLHLQRHRLRHLQGLLDEEAPGQVLELVTPAADEIASVCVDDAISDALYWHCFEATSHDTAQHATTPVHGSCSTRLTGDAVLTCPPGRQ